MTSKNKLIVFDADSRTVGEWCFTFPYGDAEAAVEPLRKLRPEYAGVILGSFGIVAISNNFPVDNPYYRASAIKVSRVGVQQ